jgi:hypothetical protein
MFRLVALLAPVTRAAITASLIFCVAGAAAQAQDSDLIGRQIPGSAPLEVLMGFNLVNLTDVSEKEETIDFEGAIYLEWQDPRLAYDPLTFGMPKDWTPGDYSRAPRQIYFGDFAVKEIYEGWRPHVVIPNGIGNRSITNMAVSIWPDGHVSYSETFYTKVEAPMDLRRFPFDTQDLEIFFHPFIYQRDEVVLVPDDRLAGTWNQNLGIADWARESVSMAERPIQIAYFDDSLSEISEFVVTVRIHRQPSHFLVSIIFPMVLLVALTWCVFWMDEETLSNRINITFIGILSVVAYYFVILDSVPEVSYLTLIDAFVIATFLVLAAGVVLTVVMESSAHKHDAALRARVDRICRWAFPSAYAMSTMVLALVFFNLY